MSDDPNQPIRSPEPGGVDIAALSAAAYADLKQLARARLRANGPMTLLDTAGLVSDTYKRLASQHNLQIENRAHFLAYCARVMRSVIVDLIREKNAQRRGGSSMKIRLSTTIGDSVFVEEEPLRVDEALADLARMEPRLAQVVELRYFGGYSADEIAEALGVHIRTVERDWQKARLILHSMLSDPD